MNPELPSIDRLKDAASAMWPELTLSGFRVNREGWTNLILETDQELLFRFPRFEPAARGFGFEVRALEFLSPRLSAPVPEPLRIGVLRSPRGWPFMSYRKLPGVPLLNTPELDRMGRRRIRDFLARLLSQLAALPAAPLRRLGCEPGDRDAWAQRHIQLYERYHRVAAHRLPLEIDRRIRSEFDAFLRILRRSEYRPVISHLDLGSYNLLWDPERRRPTGVLDWEDLRFADPAFDLTGLGFLGGSLLAPIVRARKRKGDHLFEARLSFYRRASYVHEICYAIEVGKNALLRQTLRGLRAALDHSTQG